MATGHDLISKSYSDELKPVHQSQVELVTQNGFVK